MCSWRKVPMRTWMCSTIMNPQTTSVVPVIMRTQTVSPSLMARLTQITRTWRNRPNKTQCGAAAQHWLDPQNQPEGRRLALSHTMKRGRRQSLSTLYPLLSAIPLSLKLHDQRMKHYQQRTVFQIQTASLSHLSHPPQMDLQNLRLQIPQRSLARAHLLSHCLP